MKILWTKTAVHQLVEVHDYIALENPSAAERIRGRILEQVKHLSSYPEAGRQGRVGGTRELVIVNTPYVVAYRIKSTPEIQVLAILHAKRRWPKTF